MTMLRGRPTPPVELPFLARGLSWMAIVTNTVLVIYMIRIGTWLDTASPMLSMITLGGHHRIVLCLGVVGLLLLGGLAPCTGGFARVTGLQQVLLSVADVLSLVALAGLLSVAGLGLVVIAIVVLLFRPHPRMRIDVNQRKR